MLASMSLQTLQQRFGGELINGQDAIIRRITIDSRALVEGDCFVAIVGEKFDGHQFAEAALDAGASALVVNATATLPESVAVPVWRVQDTTRALWQLALCQRESFQGQVIAITGSAGKTTVKQMLAAIGNAAFGADKVLFTQGNLNNHIGVSLTLFGLLPAHRFAVIEMGASGPGEIAPLAWQSQPQVSLVNNVMPVHVEGFGNVDGVASTKGAIYDELVDGGTAIINLDSDYAAQFAQQNAGRNRLTFALENPQADVYASEIQLTQDAAEFQLHTMASKQTVRLPVTGRHNIANALAATACALAAGISIENIVEGLSSFESAKGRFHVIRLPGELTLIDDSYNANPEAVKAAIRAQESFTGDRWLVLGDMGELGPEASSLHAEVGDFARAHGIGKLFTVGVLSQAADGLHFPSQAALIATLQEHIRHHEGPITILIKGSRGARMELVVQALQNNGGSH